MTFVSNMNLFILRLQTAQIPSPEPIMLRSHVLLMSFIGRDDTYVDVNSVSPLFIHHLHMLKNILKVHSDIFVF